MWEEEVVGDAAEPHAAGVESETAGHEVEIPVRQALHDDDYTRSSLSSILEKASAPTLSTVRSPSAPEDEPADGTEGVDLGGDANGEEELATDDQD